MDKSMSPVFKRPIWEGEPNLRGLVGGNWRAWYGQPGRARSAYLKHHGGVAFLVREGANYEIECLLLAVSTSACTPLTTIQLNVL